MLHRCAQFFVMFHIPSFDGFQVIWLKLVSFNGISQVSLNINPALSVRSIDLKTGNYLVHHFLINFVHNMLEFLCSLGSGNCFKNCIRFKLNKCVSAGFRFKIITLLFAERNRRSGRVGISRSCYHMHTEKPVKT